MWPRQVPFIRPFQTALLIYCICDASSKLFEPKSKKVARLTAELAALEADRLSKLVVVFGYEFDKLGFYTSVTVSTVLFIALLIQLSRSRRKWKRLALASANNANTGGVATYPRPRHTIMLILAVAIFFYYLTFNLGKAFESKKNKSTRSSSKKGMDSLVIVFGKYELDETTFFSLVCTSMILLVGLGAQIGIWCRQWRDSSTQLKREKDAVTKIPTFQPNKKSLNVVIVGCAPQSSGWFHLMQFLDMQNVNVLAVVEPLYLDKTKCHFPPQSVIDLVSMLGEMSIRCVHNVGQLDTFLEQTLCVIGSKTDTNTIPRLFRECIGIGASHIYLEAPGAPTIDQLKDMQLLAVTRGVEVYMGYQRTCASYVQRAVSLSRSIPKSHVFFCHNETYSSNDLNLAVSQRGMLHSMAAQELAVLVKHLGVRADEIAGFKVNTNRLFSEKQTFYINNNPENKFTDFSRVAFKITTNKRRSASVMCDRCGGLISFAVVKSHTGKELQRFPSHDADQVSMVESELRNGTEIAPQFIIESDEYLELKRRVVKCILSGERTMAGLPSIQDGLDVFALADYCKAQIDAVLTDDQM